MFTIHETLQWYRSKRVLQSLYSCLYLFNYIIFLLPLAAASSKISSDVDFFVSLDMSLKIKLEFSFEIRRN